MNRMGKMLGKLYQRGFVNKYLFLVLFIPLLLMTYPLLKPGLIIHGDYSVLDTGEYSVDKLSTWVIKGSYLSVETLPRLPVIGFWYLLSLVGIDAEAASKLMILLGFLLASLSFYFSFVFLLRNKIMISDINLKIAALVGSLIYAYNVWSFVRIGHWHLWIGYGLLPLFLVSIVYSFNNPRNWKYILASTFLWSLASITPHMTVFYGIILVGTLVVFLVKKYARRQSLIALGIPMLSVLLLYTLVNFYWIFPLVLAPEESQQELGPQYVLTYEMGEVLSRNSNFPNSLRLVADWIYLEVIEPPHGSFLYPIWSIASYVIPVVAFSALLFRRVSKYALAFMIVVIVGITLALGTRSPAHYYDLIFSIPFGWLFRDPDKWSFLTALGYSFLIGIATTGIFNLKLTRPKHIKKIVVCGFFALLISCLALYSYPIYDETLGEGGKFSPIWMPSELDRLNAYMTDLQTDKVFFMPYPVSTTTWSKNHTVENLYQTHSTLPSISVGGSNPYLQNYYNYFVKAIIENRSSQINNFIYPLGTSYILYHNDTADSPYLDSHLELLNRLYRLEGLGHLDNIGFFNIFKAETSEYHNPKQIGILKENLAIVQGLDKLTSLNSIPSFSSLNSSIVFLDQATTGDKRNMVRTGDGLILEKNVDDLALSFVNSDFILSPYTETIHHYPSMMWSKAGATDPLHGDFHPYLEELGIQNWDLDYGKGLVITEAAGASLELLFNVDKAGSYDMFLRYLKNPKGGEVRVYLDGDLVKDISTVDGKSNRFVWDNIGPSLELAEGEHILTLENVAGFNAVNIFAIIPVSETDRLVENAYAIANKTRSIYLLEAETEFLRNDQGISEIDRDSFDHPDLDGNFTEQNVSDKYGSAASQGNVLVLSPGFEIFTDLEILKSSNYTLAVRTNVCEDCTPLKAYIEDEVREMDTMDVSLRDNSDDSMDSELEWLYQHDINLQRGHYKLKIYSDTPRDLDSIVLFSSSSKKHETLDDVFNGTESSVQMSEFEGINPSKYTVKVSNATRPYIVSLAEAFDPSWTAFITGSNGSRTESHNSVPIYSITNGFYIDSVGDYYLTIENANQHRFNEGLTVSLVTVVISTIGYIIFLHLKSRVSKKGHIRP